MSNDVAIWLERLASLHKSQMRKAASAAGLQLVHLEILHYLSVCNRLSNTAQALSDYLGQTKGSISQSLKLVEKAGHIERKPCKDDGRVTRLYLTSEGKTCLKRISKDILPELPRDDLIIETLKSLLYHWQTNSHLKGFGQCKSCRHNQAFDNGAFHCGLLDEPLSKTDTQKICQEHEFEEA
ncbi:MAG: MarR family winged helix-turn-helix transcriptional regulator [Chloroflexales bacterium]|nr:MarR family winged helix-turn-helix transcriptional regulator [Chloroflexales bacterium]